MVFDNSELGWSSACTHGCKWPWLTAFQSGPEAAAREGGAGGVLCHDWEAGALYTTLFQSLKGTTNGESKSSDRVGVGGERYVWGTGLRNSGQISLRCSWSWDLEKIKNSNVWKYLGRRGVEMKVKTQTIICCNIFIYISIFWGSFKTFKALEKPWDWCRWLMGGGHTLVMVKLACK